MEIIHFATGHVFETLGAIGVIVSLLFTGLEVRHARKAQQIANLVAINRQHREIWSELFRQPKLARVLDERADLQAQPVTTEEELFVTFLILHLNVTFKATRERMFVTAQGVQADIWRFFSRPIPKSVWEKCRQMQDADFVAYVESSLHPSQDMRR